MVKILWYFRNYQCNLRHGAKILPRRMMLSPKWFCNFHLQKKGGGERFFFQLFFNNLGVSNMDLPVVVNIMVFYEKYWWTIMLLYIFSPSKHVGNTKHIYISIVFFCYARFWCAKLVCYIYYIFIFQIVDSVKPKMVNK